MSKRLIKTGYRGDEYYATDTLEVIGPEGDFLCLLPSHLAPDEIDEALLLTAVKAFHAGLDKGAHWGRIEKQKEIKAALGIA